MKKEKDKIKAVIFDIGGVLELGKYKNPIDKHRTIGVHAYVAKKLKISLDQWFDAIDTAYAESIEGKISEQRAMYVMAKNVKTSKKRLEKLIVKAYKKHFKHNKKLYKFAFKIKKKGYRIAILSDQWYLSKKALFKKKYISKFRPVIVSCNVGLRKPNPKIYKLTLKKLKLSAKECVFIDNQVWNTKPAEKLGIKSVLFKNNEQTFKALKKLGVEI